MFSTISPTLLLLVGILFIVFVLALWARDLLKKEKRLENKRWNLESKIQKFQEAYNKGWVDSRDQVRLRKIISGWEKELEAIEAELTEREDKKARKELIKLLKKAPY